MSVRLQVYIDEWIAHISQALDEAVPYGHVVLTLPEALRLYSYRDRMLLADLMQCGVEMLQDALGGISRLRAPQGMRWCARRRAEQATGISTS